MSSTLPAVFFGHGNPMNALAHNAYTEAWADFGRATPRPQALLAISAHWYGPGAGVTVATAPKTIHDFGGFPRELYQVEYPAPGDPALARRVVQLLAPVPVALDEDWGLDHGTWAVLRHMYPHADVPIVQLRIDQTQPADFHYDLGRRLAELRAEGILIVGSGNLVHNLRAYDWGEQRVEAYDWAVRFERQAREMMLADEFRPLIRYRELGQDAMLSVPTPEHYLPLLYALGTWQPGDAIRFPIEGVDGGSISMLGVQVG